jgi:hypothetical protein
MSRSPVVEGLKGGVFCLVVSCSHGLQETWLEQRGGSKCAVLVRGVCAEVKKAKPVVSMCNHPST